MRSLRGIGAAVLLAVAFFVASPLWAQTTWYVSNTGSDTNPGNNPATAFQTIQFAVNRGGTFPITIYVQAGTYPENVVVNTQGPSSAPSNLITAFGGKAFVNSITLNQTGWQVDPSIVTGPIPTPTPGGGGGPVHTDGTLQGDGTPGNPLGLVVPVSPISLGWPIFPPSAILVSQGAKTPVGVQLTKDQILQGVDSVNPPVASQDQVLGAGGHYQIRNNPPLVTNCGSGPSIVGNDSVFEVSIGSGNPVTSCTVTFNAPLVGINQICTASVAVDHTLFSTGNMVQVDADPSGNFVTISGLTSGADIGCERVTVTCYQVVQ